MAAGFVYILSHPCMPGIHKIGCTERSPSLRAAELSSATGVPGAFRVLAYFEVSDCMAAEAAVHDHLYMHRVQDNREFFRVDPLDVETFIYTNLNVLTSFDTSLRAIEDARQFEASQQRHADALRAALLGNVHDWSYADLEQMESEQQARTGQTNVVGLPRPVRARSIPA